MCYDFFSGNYNARLRPAIEGGWVRALHPNSPDIHARGIS